MRRKLSKKEKSRLCLYVLLTGFLCFAVLFGKRFLFPELTVDLSGAEAHDAHFNGNLLITDGPDPYIILPSDGRAVHSVRAELFSITPDRLLMLTAYYDYGGGFSEEYARKTSAHIGANDIGTYIPGRPVQIRLDTGTEKGRTLGIAAVILNPRLLPVSWLYPLLAALFAAAAFGLTSGAGSLRTPCLISHLVFSVLLSCRIILHGDPAALAGDAVILTVFFVLTTLLAQPFRKKGGRDEILFIVILLVFVLAFYGLLAARLPAMEGPDEVMRYDIVRYVAEHGSIPRGDDPAVVNADWGISYAYNPILPHILAGFLVRFAARFTSSSAVLLFFARYVSVLSSAGTVLMLYLIGRRLFEGRMRLVMPVAAAVFPSFIYMSCYVTTESFAVFSSALVVYAWTAGMQRLWRVRDIVLLSVGLSLCLLSYKNVYGFVLLSVPFFFLTAAGRRQKGKTVAGKAVLTFLLTFLFSGWWFIRNMILYDGDPLGISAMNRAQAANASPAVLEMLRATPKNLGVSLREMLFGMGWLRDSIYRLFGGFAAGSVGPELMLYRVYRIAALAALAGVAAAVILFFRRKKSGTEIRLSAAYHGTMFFAAAIPVLISVWYSYTADYQPQGRYFLPGFVPAVYFYALGIYAWGQLSPKQKTAGLSETAAFAGAVIPLMLLAAVLSGTVIPYYR